MMDMGPFAIFIWGSYGATALVLGALVLRALRQPKP
ncbi:heme exporter protein CcmD [uncultured Algimonas sp.]|nr:heme exporter protein CcmD [uncultured Algimonas sp.]